MTHFSKNRAGFLALTAALCIIGFFWAVSAASGVPGTEGDPVVTKSYVDERINAAIASVSGGAVSAGSTEELMTQIEYAVKEQVQKEQGTAFTPVSVQMGQTIFGGEGCEMILRSGSGLIITSTDAVVNATTGQDLKNGADAPKGNLLIISRDDGRGVKATDSCWFIVKGVYTIE